MPNFHTFLTLKVPLQFPSYFHKTPDAKCQLQSQDPRTFQRRAYRLEEQLTCQMINQLSFKDVTAVLSNNLDKFETALCELTTPYESTDE